MSGHETLGGAREKMANIGRAVVPALDSFVRGLPLVAAAPTTVRSYCSRQERRIESGGYQPGIENVGAVGFTLGAATPVVTAATIALTKYQDLFDAAAAHTPTLWALYGMNVLSGLYEFARSELFE